MKPGLLSTLLVFAFCVMCSGCSSDAANASAKRGANLDPGGSAPPDLSNSKAKDLDGPITREQGNVPGREQPSEQ